MKNNAFKPLLLALAIGTATLPLGIPNQSQAAVAMDFSDLVERVSDGVVRISITKKVSDEELQMVQEAKILQQYFGDRVTVPEIPTVEYAYGTGFFISSDGYVLTNHHVVDGADTITVTLKDRTELDAKLIGSDEASDMAVLKVKGSNFPALKVAKGDTLKVGEPVLAIGSPFGFDYSASAGIVSAKSRNFSREAAVPFIQSDVALNPGNSGGPLFNQVGEVVGVNSRIFSGTGGYMGLSFSIPIDTAMDIYDQIKSTGKVARSYLGVSLQDIDRNLAEAYRLPKPQGAVIIRITPDSPAEKLGLKTGDVILAFNGQNIPHASDLMYLLNRARPGQKYTMTYLRSGKQYQVAGVFVEAPNDVSASQNMPNNGVYLGIRISELSSSSNRLLQSFGVEGGVAISAVEYTGLAARAGLQAGDIVVNLNQIATPNIESFERAVKSLPKNGVVTISILRDGSPAILGLRIEQ